MVKSDDVEDICDYSTDENDDIVEGEPMSCDRCCYKTQKKWLMDRHNGNHAKDKPFRCPSCRFTDRDASVFVDHLVKHLPKTKIIQCCFCSFKAMPSMMKSHILRHGPTERLDCSECEYWTNSIKSMTDHIEAYHTKKHPCSMCSKVLTKYALMKHIKKVHRSKKPPPIVSAERLKKAVASRPGLTIIPVTRRMKTPQLVKKAPKKSIPTMMPVVQLERCRVPSECWKSLEASRKPQSLVTRSGIRKSLEQEPEKWEPTETESDVDVEETSIGTKTPVEIPKAKPFRKPIYFPNLVAEFGDTLLTCGICDFQTRKEPLLKRHTARHEDDMPFNCRKCDFKTISVYEFANHMVTHDGSVEDDVYSCCFCNFWTHKKHNIPIHLDRHRGATKEFDCPECEEVLTSKTGLQTHFDKLHCKALDCQFCGKNMTKFELNIHIKEHAGEVLGSGHQAPQALDSLDEQPDFPNAETEKSAEITYKPTHPLRNSKYKPKPLSRKKLDKKLDPKLENKNPKKIADETSKSVVVPKAGSSKYKPKPLSKKKIDTELKKTPGKSSPASSNNGPSVSDNSKAAAARVNYQPEPLTKKSLPKPGDNGKSAVKNEGGSGAAKKRKRSPSPTMAKSNSPKQDSAGKELECRYCDYKTQISSLMDRHREKHKADTPFKCTKCKYETLSTQKLSWHFMYHFPSQTEFPCPYCSFNSKNRMTLPLHIERHRSVRFFDCSKCQFSANNAHGVRKHFERMHVDKYSCTICDKVMTKHAMMKHLKKRHPSVYNSPASSTSTEAHTYIKHYMKYMKPVSIAAEQKGKRIKPSADEKQVAADSAGNMKPPSAQEVSGIEAAQQALAREIFGDMSDSEDNASKPSSIAASSEPKPQPFIKSDDSDDSDSDSETMVPKLSCPKCDFTTNQITGVKSHYREAHEIEYACKLCRPTVTSTKYELLSHFKKSHPAVSPDYYSNIMKCCAPEKPPENKPPVNMESDDSDDSENEANAPIASVTLSSVETCVPPPPDSTPEKSALSNGISPAKRVELEPKATENPQPPIPMDIEESIIFNEQHSSNSPPVSDSAEVPKLPDAGETENSSETAESVGRPVDKMELDVTAESKAAPTASSSSDRTASAEVKTVERVQRKAVEMVAEIQDESPDVSKTQLHCKECSFQTSRLSLLQRHSVKHKVGAPLICPQCHFQNNSPYEFLLHWTKHFPDRIAFTCGFCAFATVSKLDLALHFCVHNNTRVYDCHECDYSTSTKAFFEGHIWSIHKKVTCQKCQESMGKTELPCHKCVTARDDDVLNPPDDTHDAAAVSGAREPLPVEVRPSVKTTEVLPVVKLGRSMDKHDHGYVKMTVSGSSGKQIIARESFKTSELRKFSFLRKRDDFPSADAVSTARSPAVEENEEAVGEEPSPAFELLSAGSSFAEEESGNAETPIAVDEPSEIEKPVGTGEAHLVDDQMDSSGAAEAIVADACETPEPPADSSVAAESAVADAGQKSPADVIRDSHSKEGSLPTFSSETAVGECSSFVPDDSRDCTTARQSVPDERVICQEHPFSTEESNNAKETENVGGSLPDEHDEESCIAADSNSGLSNTAERSLAVDDSTMETSLVTEDQESSDRELTTAGEAPGSTFQCLSQEDSFNAEGSLSGVPVIDISGKHEMSETATKPSSSKAPSTSWTEPIESDDDGDGDDHNYFISPRRSKSPAADLSPRSDQQRSSPVKSEDFPGEFVTEVVFDNGMTALVLEVTDSSEEEL